MNLNFEYKALIQELIDNGTYTECRNGHQVIIPHYSFTLDHSSGNNHKLTLRKMYYKGVEGEYKTLTDPTPLTNVSQFKDNSCNYWDGFAEANGSINLDYHNQMHPQLADVIKNIKNNPASRRHNISLWDHSSLDKLSLPCCWHNLTFSVINDTLHLVWTQRSVDIMLGLPADIYLSYLFMTDAANQCDLKIGTCLYSLANCHIYDEHIVNAVKILSRTEKDYNTPLSFKLKC